MSEQKGEVFFMEQADGTWHKMSIPYGFERILSNATLLGKFRTIDMHAKLRAGESMDERDDVEMFFGEGEHGIPSMHWVEKIPEEEEKVV